MSNSKSTAQSCQAANPKKSSSSKEPNSCGSPLAAELSIAKATAKAGDNSSTSLGLGGMALALLLVSSICCAMISGSEANPIAAISESQPKLGADRRSIGSNYGADLARIYALADSSQSYNPDWTTLESHNLPQPMAKRNAELINGLIGMDLNRLHAMGKRGNAELINGLLGMDLDRLDRLGRR
ncbi:CRE-PDF-1 protein [Ditylenchus destructor]|uniref:CRE-PDF-1 protein n=1 Tax=Ditylenchus destructor TaxID=166010 RepID=A0AAD4R555_9BILA|nr:CRE-PDF-1 protein [Ditylenchus destructor]